MFRALVRWAKAVGYLLTGQLDSARRTLDTNPHVMRAKYDEIIRDKTNRIQQYKQAVAGLIAQVNELQAQGKTQDEVKLDEDYMRCLAAYNDFNSTLAEKQERINELESDIEDYGNKVKEHKVQLQHLVREIDKLKAEAADAVAEIITAKQEKDIADAFSGIVEDGSEKELQDMRKLRQEVKAEARISKEMAGTDAKAQEAEFLEYARTSVSNSEFDTLVGLAARTDAAATDSGAKDKEMKSSLPE